jgi:cell wall-associated NlpC family hydrolase
VQQPVIAYLLDDGGRELKRLLDGLLAAVVLVVLLALAVPVALFGAVLTAAAAESGQAQASSVAQLPPPPGSGPVEVARRYLGVPYVFGGTNPATGLDCSGLVQLVYRQLGMPLPRTAQQQYAATSRLPQDQLQPGDLVFFARTYADPSDWITHVGIYIGGGQQINAPTTGQVVSIQPVFSGFWGAHYAGAGRVGRG